MIFPSRFSRRGPGRPGPALLAWLLAPAVLFGQKGAATSAAAPAPPPPATQEAPARAAGAMPSDLPGLGDLLVAPTRVVFEGRTRAAELTLLNIGKQTATYRISFTHLAMTETGDLKEVETAEPGGAFVDDLVRYSPRQVTLDPNVAQTIRLQVRKPESLADGEYRSHLLFRAVPPESAVPESAVDSPEKKTGYSIRLTPIYGVSIPVIVRQGATTAKVAIHDVTIRQPEKLGDPAMIEMRIKRDGNQSVYGNLRVTFLPASGKEQVVAVLNGVAVYTPNPERLVRIPLQAPPGVSLAHGRLKVSYARAEQNGDLLGSAETVLP
jgi:hypothetical protein